MIQKITTEQAVHKYEVLDYIITSTEKLDTDVNAKNGITVEADIMLTSPYNLVYNRLFSTSDPTDYSGQNGAFASGVWGLQFENRQLCIKPLGLSGNSTSSAYYMMNTYYNDLQNYRCKYVLSCAGIFNIYNYDGTLKLSADCSSITDPNKISQTYISFFCRDITAPHEFTHCRCYDLKIYDNGVLLRHYIPVKRLSDNVIGFYDETTETFLTSATNTEFTGTSKSTPTYIDGLQTGVEYVNDIKFNGTSINRIYLDGDVYWGNGGSAPTPPSPIPSQYTVVEYIRSTGTSNINFSWINTGVYLTPNIRTEYSVRLPSNRSTNSGQWGWVQLWGSGVKNPSNNKWDYDTFNHVGNMNDQTSNPTDGSFYNRNGIYPAASLPVSDGYWLKLSNYTFTDRKDHYFEGVQEPTSQTITHTVDGVSETRTQSGMTLQSCITSSYPDGTSATSLPFYLFGGAILTSSAQFPRGFTNLDVFYFKIYDGTTPLRDFVPVYDTVSQKYGLYDKVTQAFYGSSTSVNFTGPSIS